MPFNDYACHVFAIDGYKDDARALKANDAYKNLFPQAAQGSRVRRPTGWNANSTLLGIINSVRSQTGATLSTTKIKVYGGFRSGTLQPEHMWIEYNNVIYDTMPNKALHATPATSQTRLCPWLEGIEFRTVNGDCVTSCEVFATEDQLENIKSAQIHKSANYSESNSDDEKEEH